MIVQALFCYSHDVVVVVNFVVVVVSWVRFGKIGLGWHVVESICGPFVSSCSSCSYRCCVAEDMFEICFRLMAEMMQMSRQRGVCGLHRCVCVCVCACVCMCVTCVWNI